MYECKRDCKYRHVQLAETFKRTDSSGETQLPRMLNCRLKKCFTSIQCFVYMEMIRLLPVKVPVKKSSVMNWILQAKNTELTCICAIWWLCTALLFFIFCRSSSCKRKSHWVKNAKRCLYVCVCMYMYVHMYIDIMFRENLFQAANIFSIPNSGYFKRNCEFNALLLESGLERVLENWIKVFWKFKNFKLALIS
jgi:hypothetical protein